MSSDKRDVLDVLLYELSFLEQGGYERAGKLGLPVSIFQDSLSCLNHGNPLRAHACRECLLFQFVPDQDRSQDVPCHFIPLNDCGETVGSIKDQPAQVDALKQWLRRTILQLRQERGAISEAPASK